MYCTSLGVGSRGSYFAYVLKICSGLFFSLRNGIIKTKKKKKVNFRQTKKFAP